MSTIFHTNVSVYVGLLLRQKFPPVDWLEMTSGMGPLTPTLKPDGQWCMKSNEYIMKIRGIKDRLRERISTVCCSISDEHHSKRYRDCFQMRFNLNKFFKIPMVQEFLDTLYII